MAPFKPFSTLDFPPLTLSKPCPQPSLSLPSSSFIPNSISLLDKNGSQWQNPYGGSKSLGLAKPRSDPSLNVDLLKKGPLAKGVLTTFFVHNLPFS